ncbi:MAG: hypothetical protein AMXMBFR48_26890 [Ignavibacteriales bacterium]
MPGSWNSWTNPPTNNLAFASSTQVAGGRITKIKTGTLRWQTIFKVAASGGDLTSGNYEFSFSSGPTTNIWENTWKNSSQVTMNSLDVFIHQNGAGNNLISVANGKWYVMNWKDNGYNSTYAIFMELSGEPVALSSVTHTAIDEGENATVYITTGTAPAPEEKIFVRYTTDDFTTSQLVQATGSGTSWVAVIPGSAVTGTENNKYYAFTTTVSNPTGSDADMQTIKNTTAARLTLSGWHIKINASTGALSDTTAMAGQSPTATDGYDIGIDIPKPPTPVSNYIEVFFPHTGWSQVLGNRYTRDIRLLKSLAESTEEWDFTVNTDKLNQDVTLLFSEFLTIPAEYDITLFDISAETEQDLRVNGTYSYNSGQGGEKLFRLIVGYQPDPPQISVSPSSVNFGEVKETKSKTERVVISNTGEQVLEIASVTVAGAAFSALSLTGSTLDPGDTLHLPIVFSPDEIGLYEGAATISSNSNEDSELIILLSGTGIELPILISSNTDTLDFNSVKATLTKSDTLTLYNTGEGALSISNVAITNEVFALVSSPEFSIEPGDSSKVVLSFTPPEVGSYSGTVTFLSNATNTNPFVVDLAGEGITLPVNITSTPSSLAFGTVKLTQSKKDSVLIANTDGEGDLVITSVSVVGDAAFTTNVTTPVTLGPDESFYVKVTFAPASAISYSADLTFVSNANNVSGEFTVPLSGTGTELVPNGTVSPSEIAFGDVAVGNSSVYAVSISNTGGDIPLSISAVTFSQPGFTLDYSGGYPITVIPNATVELNIKFKPVQVASYSSVITFASNNQTDLTVSLTGTGTKRTVQTELTTGWNLISVPVRPDDESPAAVFGDDFATYFLFQYGNSGGYTVPTTVKAGLGYWLGLETGGTFDVYGTANVEEVETALLPGWNIISSPFYDDFLTSEVMFRKGEEVKTGTEAATAGWIQNIYYGYTNGAYAPSEELWVWNGYWFSALMEGVYASFDEEDAGLPTSKSKQKDGIEPETESDLDNWAVPIIAAVNNVSDNLLAFGASVNATDGFDALYDFAKPPVSPAPDALSTYFEQSGWSPYFNRYASDIRAKYEFPQPGKSWSFNVTSKEQGDITLSWDDITAHIPEAIRNNYHFRMTGPGIVSNIDMLTVSSVTFNAETGVVYTFEINSSLTSTGDDVNIPKEFSLGQNFPNPFNPSTTIAYNVKETAQVTIKVYDMIGNEVATLVDEVKPAGSYNVSFDASKLSSGVYLYKMRAGNFVQIRKLVLMK